MDNFPTFFVVETAPLDELILSISFEAKSLVELDSLTNTATIISVHRKSLDLKGRWVGAAANLPVPMVVAPYLLSLYGRPESRGAEDTRVMEN